MGRIGSNHLLIFAEFQGDFPGNKRDTKVNAWVEFVQVTPKVILHIFSEFQTDFRGTTRHSIANSCVELYLEILFTLKIIWLPGKSYWNSSNLCRMTFEVLWTNSTNGFPLKIIWFSEKSSSNSADIRVV